MPDDNKNINNDERGLLIVITENSRVTGFIVEAEETRSRFVRTSKNFTETDNTGGIQDVDGMNVLKQFDSGNISRLLIDGKLYRGEDLEKGFKKLEKIIKLEEKMQKIVEQEENGKPVVSAGEGIFVSIDAGNTGTLSPSIASIQSSKNLEIV